MQSITQLTGLILGIIGCAMIAYLSLGIFKAITFTRAGNKQLKTYKKSPGRKPSRVKYGYKLRKARKKFKEIDQLIDQSNYIKASKLLEKTVVLNGKISETECQAFNGHYADIISRAMIISEQVGGDFKKIAEIEVLLTKRIELHESLNAQNSKFANFRKRRQARGKETKTWGEEDFTNKISSLKQQIKENYKNLSKSLPIFFKNLPQKQESQATYH